MTAYARANGVDGEPTVTMIGADVRHLCTPARRGIELFVIDGGGHTWPGSADTVRLLGTTTPRSTRPR